MPSAQSFLLSRTLSAVIWIFSIAVSLVFAQPPSSGNRNGQASGSPVPSNASTEVNPEKATPASALVIGPGDELEIAVYGVPDLSTHTRVSGDGNISMPLVGYVHVGGLTSTQAERAVEQKLRQANMLRDPHVSMYVKEYASAGVSVVGQVMHPGVYSALGAHRLLDILQAAGGVSDRAADNVSIAHRAHADRVQTIQLSKNPLEMSLRNIELQPGDTVFVPEAGIVYVLGEVNKPGGYVLNTSGGVTVLQVVAAAGGPTRVAALGGVKMVRRTSDGLREIPVPLKNLLRAKSPDVSLQTGDILYVPSSRVKGALNAAGLISAVGSSAIYRLPL